MDIELIPEDIIATLEGSVERLKVLYKERRSSALSDGVTEVMQLCMTIEAVLRHSQKEKSSFWGERRDYWHYLSEGVGELKGLDSIVKIVQAQQQVTTGLGRGRALIRRCLCEGLLADCIQNAVSNTKRTKEWYHGTAILLTPILSHRVLTALYDLSQVSFDLQSEGIDLDETWPSFVLKSFDGNGSGSGGGGGGQKEVVFGGMGSHTKDAAVLDKSRLRMKHSILEQAIEEHPTEIFVKHEVPFNLPLVGSLLAEIRGNLIERCDLDHMTALKNALPELKVDKLDDITSCLTVLSEYVGSWSQGVSECNTSIVDELKLLKAQFADLELQLQETLLESETSETSLVTQIQRSRKDLRSYEGEAHQLSAENKALNRENMELRRKISKLETLNFDLDEQLVCSGSDTDSVPRNRSSTILEASLVEKDEDLANVQQSLESREQEMVHLKAQLEQAELQLQASTVTQESLTQSQASALGLTSDLESSKARERELSTNIEELKRIKEIDVKKLRTECESEIMELRRQFETELSDVKGRLELELDNCKNVLYERDEARAELGSMQGMVESETASLRFQISTQAFDLQRTRETNKGQERSLSDHKSRVANLESQLGEVSERCEGAESQIEELKVELLDMEGILSTNKNDLSSISEQLAEKSLSQDLERSQTIRLHKKEVEGLSAKIAAEKAELSRQVDRLGQENEDMRKAFKRLLQQKVTLWQHADKLEQEQVAKGTWINEKSIPECMGCGMTFSVFNRKHHCRSCGKVFCTSCCDKKAQLPFSKDPVRVCDDCHDKIQDVRTPMSAKMVNTLEMESVALPQGSMGQAIMAGPNEESGEENGTGSRNSLNITRNTEVNGNSLLARLHQQNIAGSLPSIDDTGSTISGDNSFMELASKYLAPAERLFDNESITSVNSTDYLVDPELKQREAEKMKGEQIDTPDGNVHISSVEGGGSDDDGYYVIESDPQNCVFPVGLDSPGTPKLNFDALASKLASLEVTNTIEKSHARRISDCSSSSSGVAKSSEYKEVVIDGGGVQNVPIAVVRIGTAIVWEFSTEPKGIAFGIWYKEKKDSQKEVEVLPLKRCMSHKATLTGEYVAQKNGVYVLKFDNCHSKYTGRKLLYKVWTRSPL